MNYDLTSPCGNCPFRSDKPFHLRRGRMVEILRTLIYGDSTFTCHKTSHGSGYDDDEPEDPPTQPEQQCAGALILLHRLGILRWNAQFRVAERFGPLNVDNLNMDAPVHKSLLQTVRAVERMYRGLK